MSNQTFSINFIRPISLFLLTLTSLGISSCEDFVDIDPPPTEIFTETVFNSDETALAAMRGVYTQMIEGGMASGDLSSISVLGGLSSDELLDFGGGERLSFNSNNLDPLTAQVLSIWSQAYELIYFSNSILEGLENSNGISETFRNQLEGESKFVRAFSHFYLANLYGDIPIIKSTEFRVNTSVSRSPVTEVYEQIIEDLQDAINLLSEDYSFAEGERAQPNKFAAIALLARVYLYLEEWENAELEATRVINNSIYRIENDFDAVFLANSNEAIWQLQPVSPGANTNDAQSFINLEGNFPSNLTMTERLANSFEDGDLRRTNWLDSIIVDSQTFYHANKYKINEFNQPLTEYSMVFRLGEQFLIRAEARANQNKLTESIMDLDVIRGRAALPLIQDINPTISQANLLLAIEHERQVELFTEWGHRWFDLKRTGRAESILLPIPLKDWQSTDELYPIPESELEVNGNLTQNNGY